MKRVLLISALLACAAALAPVASGDVQGCASDDSVAGACPAQSGHWYYGVFESTSKTGNDDFDYLKFPVAKAGETVGFSLLNTTDCTKAADIYQDGCPVYLTLMNSSNQQVGGDNSGAGTITTSSDPAESFSWTFAQPGTYYMLLESDGSTSGTPTYKVRYTLPSPPPPPPLVKSFTAASPQHGKSVHAKLVLGRAAAKVHQALYHLRTNKPPQLISSSTLFNLGAGTHHLVFTLTAHWKQVLAKQHHLSLLAKVTVTPKSGRVVTKSVRVTLES